MESELNRNGRTKLSLALPAKHPALILELKGITQNRETLWTGRNFAPWAFYIPNCEDDDESRYQSNVGILQLR